MFQATYENEHRGVGIAVSASVAGYRMRAILGTLRNWQQRSAQRRSLSQLSPHLLEDVGITPQQQYEETRKPFWRA